MREIKLCLAFDDGGVGAQIFVVGWKEDGKWYQQNKTERALENEGLKKIDRGEVQGPDNMCM